MYKADTWNCHCRNSREILLKFALRIRHCYISSKQSDLSPQWNQYPRRYHVYLKGRSKPWINWDQLCLMFMSYIGILSEFQAMQKWAMILNNTPLWTAQFPYLKLYDSDFTTSVLSFVDIFRKILMSYQFSYSKNFMTCNFRSLSRPGAKIGRRLLYIWGTAVAHCLTCCVTNLKAAG